MSRLEEIAARLERNAVPDPHHTSEDCRECSDARDLAALLAFVREVAALNDRYMRGEITGVALSIDLHAAVTALTKEETDAG